MLRTRTSPSLATENANKQRVNATAVNTNTGRLLPLIDGSAMLHRHWFSHGFA